MAALLVIATIIDVLLAALLVAVSGFILQGVNNTGPMAGAAWYVAFVIFCVAAPIVAWIVRKRAPPAIPTILVLAPIAIAIVALLVEPMFT